MTKEVPYNLKDLEDWNERYGKLRAGFVAQFLPSKGRLLDVGGFQGDLKRYVSREIDYYLVDLFAPKGMQMFEFDLNFLNEKRLPFEDKFFDMVVAIDIFEHIKRPFELLEEIRRVLKDDGLLITSRHLIVTKRHYFVITEAFFEDWKEVKREPIAEVYMEIDGKMFYSIVKSASIVSEVFYLLRKA